MLFILFILFIDLSIYSFIYVMCVCTLRLFNIAMEKIDHFCW